MRPLLQLCDQARPSPQACKIALTQRDLADMIGMSRESTNKQLRMWQKRNWIRLERGGIMIVAPEALAAVASNAGQGA